MPAPTITLENTTDTMVEVIPSKISYLLYEDTTNQFEEFYTWVANPFNLEKSGIEAVNGANYSKYVLKFFCDITAATTPEGSGCCMRSESDGGFCLIGGEAPGDLY